MNILITGTSSGIGAGLANHYLNEGHHVMGMSRRTNIELANNPNYIHVKIDLGKFKQTSKMIHQELGSWKPELVILNAGMLSKIADMKDTTLEEMDQVMKVNVYANKVILDTLLRMYPDIRQIVAISSGAAISGARGWNAYSLSKASLNMLIKLYAAEYPDVHFTAFAPGLVDTAMQDYIAELTSDSRFPIVDRLKAARGTDTMPKPDDAAKILAQAIEKLPSYPSGDFVDVRKMD